MFKKMRSFCGRLTAGVAAVGAGSTAALADPTPIINVSGLTPDVTMVGTLGLAICTGLLGIWGVRKVIKLINRS